MADGQHKINIVLTLDGQNFTGNIKTAGDAAKMFNKVVGNSTKHAKGSVDDLSERLRVARKTFDSLPPSSAKYGRSLQHVQALQNRLSKSTQTATMNMSKFGGASGQTGFAVLNMNRVISDAPFGMIAISNNIDPLVQSMLMLKKTSGGVKGMFGELGKSMMGPLGLMTAVSLVTALVTKYTMVSSRNKTAIKNQKDEVGELIKKLREYKGSLQDLEKLQNKSVKKEQIEAKENLLDTLNRDIKIQNKAGLAVTSPFAYSQLLKEKTTLLQEIKDMKSQLKVVDELTKVEKELREKITEKVYSIGSEDLAKYLKPFGFKVAEMKSVLRSFENETDRINVNTDAFDKNKIARENLSSAISVFESTGSEKTKVKVAKIEKAEAVEILPEGSIADAKKQLAELNTELSLAVTEIARDRIRDEIKKLEALLKEWETGIKREGEVPSRLKPVKITAGKLAKEPTKFTKDELEEAKFKADILTLAINDTANAMIDGFMEGNFQISEMISNMGALIAKLLIVQGLKTVVGGLLGPESLVGEFVGGLFGSHSSGGLATKPQHMQLVNPKVFANAPHFSGGGIAGIPAILHKKEMILTENDQINLLNFVRSARGSSYGGGNRVNVNLSGSLKSSKGYFVSEFNKANTTYQKTRGVGSVNIINS